MKLIPLVALFLAAKIFLDFKSFKEKNDTNIKKLSNRVLETSVKGNKSNRDISKLVRMISQFQYSTNAARAPHNMQAAATPPPPPPPIVPQHSTFVRSYNQPVKKVTNDIPANFPAKSSQNIPASSQSEEDVQILKDFLG